MAYTLRPMPAPQALGNLVPYAKDSRVLTSLPTEIRVQVASAALESESAELVKKVVWGNLARGYLNFQDSEGDRSAILNGQDLSPRYDWKVRIPIDELKLPKIPPLVEKGEEEYEAEEPFLHIHIQTPRRHPATGRLVIEDLHLSDIDRPVGRGEESIQLDGRVLELAYCGRRVSADGGIARMQTTLILDNHDGALNSIFQDPAFLKARLDIKVGFRSIPPSWYRRVGPVWRIDRVNSISSKKIELALIDATDGLLGAMKEPPTINDFHRAVEAYVANVRKKQTPPAKGWPPVPRPLDEHKGDPYLNVPFGGEWVKVKGVIEGVRTFTEDSRRAHYICIGATRNPMAILETPIYEITSKQNGKHRFTIARLLEGDEKRLEVIVGPAVQTRLGLYPKTDDERNKHLSGTPSYIDFGGTYAYRWEDSQGNPHFEQRPVLSSATRLLNLPVKTADGTQWYLAVIQIARGTGKDSGDASATTALYEILVDGKNPLGLDRIEGDIYVQWVFGAEGSTEPAGVAWRGKHDPVSMIQHLAHKYMGENAHLRLHDASFNLARRSGLASLLFGVGVVGGTYTRGQDGGEVISALAKCHGLDLWWGSDGLLHVQNKYPSRDELLEKVAGAPIYDAQWEILRETWSETVPIGAERWGVVNHLRYTGAKEYTRPGFERELGEKYGVNVLGVDEEAIEAWGRVLQKDVPLDWVVTAHVSTNGQVTEFPLFNISKKDLQHRTVVTFYAPLFALELDVGDFVRITHPHGSQELGGYKLRLFRVEEIGLEWSTKRCKVVAVDMTDYEERNSAILDDESKWIRAKRDTPDGVHSIITKATEVELTGPMFSKELVKPGDFILVETEEGELSSRVVSVGEWDGIRRVVTVDTPLELNREHKTFTIQRSHLDPPTDAEFPGSYPFGNEIYFRACDEETGLFSDNTPGYKVEAE